MFTAFVERDHGYVPRHLGVGAVKDERAPRCIEDAIRLIEVARNESLAVPGVVPGAAAAVDVGRVLVDAVP